MLQNSGVEEAYIMLIYDEENEEILSPARIYHLKADGWAVDHARKGSPVFDKITQYWKDGKLQRGGKISSMMVPITGGSLN